MLSVRAAEFRPGHGTRPPIGKLTGPAQLWYTLTFANDPTTATEAKSP